MSRVKCYEPCPRCRSNGKDQRGDNFAAYEDGGGHCFSCGLHRWPSHYVPRIEKEDRASTLLPTDATREIPANAWKWLLQYGLSYSYWKKYLWWSEKDSRLVFTVGEPPNFSTGRYLGTEKKAKWFHYGDCHKNPFVIGNVFDTEKVVLVEDLISAHKVGQVVPAIPLFGTNLFPALVPVLRHLRAPITMWLDKDQEQHARKRANRLGILTGLPVSYVFTDQDPKSLSLQRIKEVLEQ